MANSSAGLFRRPLGLVLQGGGALGAWQAGALQELESSLGPVFNAVLGFSVGAINAAAYALGRVQQGARDWAGMHAGVLRLAPRLKPLPALFSDEPLRRALEFSANDAQARKSARCRLVVASARIDRRGLVHGVFEPAPGRWDGPLRDHLLASAAIPWIFPAVRLQTPRPCLCFDGGVPCGEPLDLGLLGHCKDLLVLEMVRADELDRQPWSPLGRLHWSNRAVCRRLIDASLAALDGGRPRIFRLAPSRRLAFEMLQFKEPLLQAALAQGRQDVRDFLVDPRASRAVEKLI